MGMDWRLMPGSSKKYKSIPLSEKYKEYRKRRIVYMRDKANPPVSFKVIGRRFDVAVNTVKRIYEESKNEQKKT